MINAKPNQTVDLSDQIKQFEIAEQKSIGSDFKNLLRSLPELFSQWHKWFVPVFLSSASKKFLMDSECFKAALPASRPLLNYALTPQAFYFAIDDAALFFNHFFKEDSKIQGDDDNIVFQINGIPVSFENFTFAIDTNNVSEENRVSMASWLLCVLGHRPDLIPGFMVHKDGKHFVVEQVEYEDIKPVLAHRVKLSSGEELQMAYPPKLVEQEQYKDLSRLQEWREHLHGYFRMAWLGAAMACLPLSRLRYKLEEKLWQKRHNKEI